MSRVFCMFVIVIVVGSLFAGLVSAEGMTTPSLIEVVEDGNVHFLRTDGTWAVWSYTTAEEWVIAAARLDSPSTPPIILQSSARPADAPDVDNGIAVWHVASNWPNEFVTFDIYGADLATGRVFPIAATTAYEAGPSISGDWVVWAQHDATPNSHRIMARNIATMDEAVVVAEEGEPYRWVAAPVIDGRRVVWLSGVSPVPDGVERFRVMQGDLSGVSPVTVDDVVIQDRLGIPLSLRGDWLAYGGNSASRIGRVLTMKNLASGEVRQLDRIVGGFSLTVSNDGRYVYWVDDGLWAYDLQTASYFQIEPASDRQRQVGVAAADDMVVWLRDVCPQGGDGPCSMEIWKGSIDDIPPSSPRPDPGTTSSTWIYFPQTGHYLSQGFRTYWAANGGLSIFGYPLTEEFRERNPDTSEDYTVQYTERQRFEYHPEHAGTSYEVLLGRLGVQVLMQQGRDWETFSRADPAAPHYFDLTGHAIAPQFWAYWSQHGLEFGDAGVSLHESLALFGYPISEPMQETNADGDTVLTQYFERAVFELHPDNSEPYRVLLRRVGAEVLAMHDW